MSKWIEAPFQLRQYTAYEIATEKNISDGAIEKDWWVTAILKSLFALTPSPYMFFKGGTSLSKAWNIIDRFSEDIDIAPYRDFYLDVLSEECARAVNNNQIKKLRVVNRDYIVGEFAEELRAKLKQDGYGECKVNPVIFKADGTPVDHDSDPVVIEVEYPSTINTDYYLRPVVKIEISCLSMKEPYEIKHITSLLGERFSEIDDETFADIPTITPTRTFLEKAFLLNEEYQLKNPRTERMSRHLYDLERLMDTPYAEIALTDLDLYKEIIAHRKYFYHLGGVDYDMNNPSTISFCPTGKLRESLRSDYETMKLSMIYGDKLSFEQLIERIEHLQTRFRNL